MLNAISSFAASIRNSLRLGLVCQQNITLEFPRYVFNFLFNGKGSPVKHRSGRVLERIDFSAEHFNDSHFEYYNKDREGCFISFPIYMNSFVKFSTQSYSENGCPLPHGFTETLSIKVKKTYSK